MESKLSLACTSTPEKNFSSPADRQEPAQIGGCQSWQLPDFPHW
jgi:hypothetical protein